MPPIGPRYEKEEFARRGDRLYEQEILPKLSAKDKGKFVAIDIETGEYEIGKSEAAAGKRMKSRRAEAQIWMVLVGSAAVRKFGGHYRRTAK